MIFSGVNIFGELSRQYMENKEEMVSQENQALATEMINSQSLESNEQGIGL